jgi:formyl-CoA transferase
MLRKTRRFARQYNMSMQPLKGLKVVDLSKVLAGPLCGQFLGELGAEVVKVEPVNAGDDTRSWLPQEKGQSAMFLAVNHNKRSLAIDLKTVEGRGIVHELVKGADIVLQGFGGGTAQKLAVDYQSLSALNPKLIYLEISGYGRDGPLGAEPGYDVMLQAFSGMISTMGEAGNRFLCSLRHPRCTHRAWTHRQGGLCRGFPTRHLHVSDGLHGAKLLAHG